MMTLQEIFDKVAVHLLTQNRQAIVVLDGSTLACHYKSPHNDDRCAVGVLLTATDPKTLELLEGTCRTDEVVQALRAAGVLDNEKSMEDRENQERLGLLRTLQQLHDEDEPVLWPSSLRRVAREYRLGFPVLPDSGTDTDTDTKA